MSGHSKWKNIMHKKEKTDAQRAKIFTKIGREISLAVREGGPDPVSNATLKDLIAKAKSNNVPNDNIERVIKKAAGGNEGANYEVLTYEGGDSHTECTADHPVDGIGLADGSPGGDGHITEGIDRGLDQYIGNRKKCTLKSGRNTYLYHLP